MHSGFLIINKPRGLTSHDVVNVLRKKTGQKKIGHAGTLDPIATGVLICGINKATKRLSDFMHMGKKYLAEIKLGEESDTYDAAGRVRKNEYTDKPQVERVKKAVEGYVGDIQQFPPPYCAKKIKGKKMYELARQGVDIKLKSAKVRISSIEIISYTFPWLKIRVSCSKGTYIRSLAHDIGKDLGVGGLLNNLIRTGIGAISLENAHELEEINGVNWMKLLLKDDAGRNTKGSS